jgi:bacterioferritin (cytochrome b1)
MPKFRNYSLHSISSDVKRARWMKEQLAETSRHMDELKEMQALLAKGNIISTLSSSAFAA